jgi:hypoxanthine phosphoribosyltransferase
MSKRVKVLDKEFEINITHDKIQATIKEMAQKMNQDLKGKDVIFMGILNGSFMFAGDLFKHIDLPCQITFLKLASYQGTSSTGTIKRLIGVNEDIKDKTVVVLEDIVDTGITLDNIKKQLLGYEPAEIKMATLLFKPEAYEKDVKLDYIGISIPNDFILGYGLDYDGFGRNLADIYKIVNE